MGASFLFAICPVPRYSDDRTTPTMLPDDVADELEERALGLSKDQAEVTCEGAYGESLAERSEGARPGVGFGVAEIHKDIIDDLVDAVNLLRLAPRSLGVFRLEERSYYITGGCSWGDAPTETFDPLRLLEFSGITEEPLGINNPVSYD